MKIEELTIECEEISRVETNHTLGNNIRVTLSNADDYFLADLTAKEVITGMDGNELIEAIVEVYGIEFIRDWHDNLGKS